MQEKNDYNKYKELTDLSAVSGHERSVRKYIKKEMLKYTDNILQDRLGSVFGVLNNYGPTILVAAHMDEVGAIVVGITDEGLIKLASVGGINPEVLVSQQMELTISDDKKIRGIVGSIPPHLLRNNSGASKPVAFEDLRFDIGADSKEKAIEMGVKLGQQVTFINHFFISEDGQKLVGKALDDRFGCGMVLEILNYFSEHNHPNKLICGCTVQEEIGLRGGQTSSQMIKPDLFLAVDVSPAVDFVDTNNLKRQGELGQGFLLRFYDPSCLMHDGLRQYIIGLADKNKIKWQNYKSAGGTDAAVAQYTGKTLSTTIGLPGRYIHSTNAMISVDDMEAVKRIIIAIIEEFDNSILHKINQNV